MPMQRSLGALRALALLAAVAAAPSVSAQVVISQVYGGGGNSGAVYTHDFVELFNAGSAPADLAGLTLRYASNNGNFPNSGTNYFELPADTIPPGGYYLVQMAVGANTGMPGLPTPDAIGAATMGGTNGKIVLATMGDLACGSTTGTPVPCSPGQLDLIIDLVGFGSATMFEGSAPTAVLSNATGAMRKENGCQDTDDNGADFDVVTPVARNSASPAAQCGSPKVVISQVYGGGGNSGAVYTHDFVELFNAGSAPADLAGLTLRYASNNGNFPNAGTNYFELPADTIPPGGYYLVQMAAGSNLGLPGLPTPDATGAATMGGTNGKIVLATTGDLACGSTTGTPVPCSPGQLDLIVDLVGFGSATMYEGSAPTAVLSNATGAMRKEDGCQDTDDNGADFDVVTPVARNSAAPAHVCGGGGGTDLVLSIASASVVEGDSGTTHLDFIVTLSGPAPEGGVAFVATTTDGTATSPDDFTALSFALFAIDEGETTTTVSVQVNGDTTVEPDETFTVSIDTPVAGVVLGTATATGTIINDDAEILAINAIQGSGLRSPLAPVTGNGIGTMVSTTGNIVTAISSNGFFMQTPDGADDGNPATSEGIFVFTGSAPNVQIGDVVNVNGSVQEYYEWTQLTGVTVTVTASGATLPTPVVLDETRPSADLLALSCPETESNFECFENMLVHVPAGAVVQGNQRFGSDPFGEAFVTASGERTRREKGLLPNVTPPVPGLPVWDGNPEVFELDADGAGAVPTGTALFGGDLFEATGVIAYQFGNYALRPTSLTIVPADLPRAVPASAGDAELRIGSFNTLNLCQGSCNATKVARVAAYIGDVLGLPDVVGLQELHGTGAATALAARLNDQYGTDYVAYTGSTPHSDGIRNGFLVKAGRVDVTRVRNLNAGATIDVCEGTPPCVMHDRPPYLLEATFTGGEGERFAVMNNHTRSLIGIGDDGATGTRVRAKRFAQGKDIAQLVQRFQEGEELEPASPVGNPDTAGVPLVLVGDYNAFEVTDGYADVVGLITGHYDDDENEYQLSGPNIVDPPLQNLVLDVPLDDRYSYTYTEDLGDTLAETPRNVGSVQVLDHGMVNEAALTWCGGLHYGRGNADAPVELRNTGTGAVGSSDHDGLVVRLFTDRLFIHDFEDSLRCRR
jgi:predicted extracellular nuclease